MRGGVVAGTSCCLARRLSFLSIYELPTRDAVSSIFFGVKAAVGVVTTAFGAGAENPAQETPYWHHLAAFLASFVFAVPFPIVIVGAALAAYFFGEAPVQTDGLDEDAEGRAIDSRIAAGGSPKPYQALFIAVFCACLWLVPVALLYRWLGAGNVYVQEAVFFSKMAVVTFGGAYAVLPT